MIDSQKLLDAWMPPDEAGAAIACLTTTFTFEPEFFEGECLSRFLSLDTARNEDDISELAFLIEQEERLGETRATVLVDRSYQAEGRSLRWDVLPVWLPGGVQHAKICVLLWDEALRIVVSSANVVASSYRRNIETGLVIDLFHGVDKKSADLALAVVEEVGRVVALSPGTTATGPKSRAQETLALADRRVRSLDLHRGRTRLRTAVVAPDPGRSALQEMQSVWVGSLPSRARVLSPFFDVDETENQATIALLGSLRRRGRVQTTFVVPVDYAEAASVIRAPRSILRHQSERASIQFEEFPQEDEPRRLHAKVLLLESDEWLAALVGSSNFTAAGHGLLRSGGNAEINIAIGVPIDSVEASRLRALIPLGEVIDPEAVDWEPEVDEDQPVVPVLPIGFVECLLDPVPQHEVIVHLRAAGLPDDWSISLVQAEPRVLLTAAEWRRRGRPATIRLPLEADERPFLLRVRWTDGTADWPLNVTDPERLPPVEQLRRLPPSALIEALASTRPLHEALAAAIQRRENGTALAEVDLDPLRRYSSTGHLFQRTKRLSAALEGIRARLERPAGTIDVLLWRLRGPFGPRALAEGIVRDRESGVPGEAAFFIAELALSLSRIDWSTTAQYIPQDEVKAAVNSELRHLRKLARAHLPSEERLCTYVQRALRAAHL